MRTFLAAAVLLLLVPRVDAATLTIDVLGFRFVETGTPTACLNCDDADPLNDVVATLAFPSFLPVPPAHNAISWSGSVGFFGTTATHPTDIDLHIAIDVAAFLDGVLIDASTLTGRVFGIENGMIVETCCGGIIASMSVDPAGFFPIPFFPNGGVILGFEVHPPRPAAVPEPSSLLLLATGCLGLANRARLVRRRLRRVEKEPLKRLSTSE